MGDLSGAGTTDQLTETTLPSTPVSGRFHWWRRIHRAFSYAIALIALVHCAFTLMWDAWSPNAVWFLGTGVGLLTIAVINLAHVGRELRALPTAPVVRWLNWMYVVPGLAALVAVREPQAIFIVAALVGQAIAGRFTLYNDSRAADT